MGSHYGRFIAATQPESSRQIGRDRQEITLTGIQAMRIRVPEGKRYCSSRVGSTTVARSMSSSSTGMYPGRDVSPLCSSSAHSAEVATRNCPVMALQQAVSMASRTIIVSTSTMLAAAKTMASSLKVSLVPICLEQADQFGRGYTEQTGRALV